MRWGQASGGDVQVARVVEDHNGARVAAHGNGLPADHAVLECGDVTTVFGHLKIFNTEV